MTDLAKHPTHIRPTLFRAYPHLVVAESTRHGGHSAAPYYSQNLGLYTEDAPERVRMNRNNFFAALGFRADQVAGARQVHGSRVLRVMEPGEYDGYDALITNHKDILLSITIADCCPVLLYDPVHGAVGAAHAGWRGTTEGVVGKMEAAMRDFYGTKASECLVYLGTSISQDAYEVDADVADHFAERYKRWDPSTKKYYLDVAAANVDQLLQLGVPRDQIARSPYCTSQDYEHFFSHRREQGKTGRSLAVIGMQAELAEGIEHSLGSATTTAHGGI